MTQTLKSKIEILRNTGKTYDRISAELGCSKGTISYHLNKEVQSSVIARTRNARKKQMRDLKFHHGGACNVCGYNEHLEPLQFHHPDPSNKDSSISKLLRTNGKKAAWKEAEKCTLLCSRCHSEEHVKLLKSFKENEDNSLRSKFNIAQQKKRKRQMTDLKLAHGGQCKSCEYNDFLEPLHFHHYDPANKINQVSALLVEQSKTAAWKEAEKCILVCCRCHIEIHAGYRTVEHLL